MMSRGVGVKRKVLAGADEVERVELPSLLVPRCNVGHIRDSQFHLVRRRCVQCGAHKRVRLARCVYSVQHMLGFAVQVRKFAECREIGRILVAHLAIWYVAMVLDMDRGGTSPTCETDRMCGSRCRRSAMRRVTRLQAPSG